MSKVMTISADAYCKLLSCALNSSGLVRSTYFEAAQIILDGCISAGADAAPAAGYSVVDYVLCNDMFLSDTLRQLDAQGSEIVSVNQCEHQYTIFFRTTTANCLCYHNGTGL